MSVLALAMPSCVDCGRTLTRKSARRCIPCFKMARPQWTRDDIKAAIVRWYVLHGRPPMSTEWRKRGEWPTRRQVTSHFATFNDAIRAAGLTPRGTGKRRGERWGRRSTARTVANGYTPQEELDFLIEQQHRELSWGSRLLGGRGHTVSVDALSSEWLARHGLAYSDGWTAAVCALVDYRRDIDRWSEAA